MFTPEREYASNPNRMRELTPKTPLPRLKMDEDDLTPLSLRKADLTLSDYDDQIAKVQTSVEMHLNESIREQKNLIIVIKSALNFANEYERSDEAKLLNVKLIREKRKLQRLEEFSETKINFKVF